jgi:hypothetical protein
MYTPSPYKRATTCLCRNFQTIVETVLNTTINISQISLLAMNLGFNLMSQSEQYITKYGQPKEVKDLA